MTNVGEVTKRPGTTAMQAGLVIVIVGAVLMILNALSEGRPPGWTVGIVVIGAVASVIGYARRILAALEAR